MGTLSQQALKPGGTIGIFGGGQLGRMLASSAIELGFQAHIFTPNKQDPALQNCPLQTIAAYDDLSAVENFARSVDVLTFEFENIPVETLQRAAQFAPLHPALEALSTTRDRLSEKEFLQANDVVVAPFTPIDGLDDLTKAIARAPFAKAILKTRREGYDGKGQIRLDRQSDLAKSLDLIENRPAILEAIIPFEWEFSLLGVRAVDGTIRFYDCPRNDHFEQILRRSTVPSNLNRTLTDQAQEFGTRILNKFAYVGVMAIEFFYLGEDAPTPILVNEIAPRVHNSGHWTMDACSHSQFNNHIRAIAGMALGSTQRHSDVIMHNLIGETYLADADNLSSPSHCRHLYGKNIPRKGRKMGHINELLTKTNV